MTLLIGLVSGAVVLWPSSTKAAPDPRRTLRIGYSPPTNRLLAWTIAARAEAARINAESGLPQRRVRWLRRQLRALLLGIVLLLLAYLCSSLPILGS